MVTRTTPYLFKHTAPLTKGSGLDEVDGNDWARVTDRVAGGVQLAFADSPYTLLVTDGYLAEYNCNGGASVLNLMALSAARGGVWCIINSGTSNNLTINRAGADTFSDGSTSQTLTPGQLTVISASTTWRIIL